MFLYYEIRQVRIRKYYRIAWGQQVREGHHLWQLSISTGDVGFFETEKQKQWFKHIDELNHRIHQCHGSILEKGYQRLTHPSVEQLNFPFIQDELLRQLEMFPDSHSEHASSILPVC